VCADHNLCEAKGELAKVGTRSAVDSPVKGAGLFMKTCYVIIRTRSFYGAETKSSLVVEDTGSQYLSFASRGEARAWIRKLAGQKHCLTQNDSNPPAYAVAEVGSRDFHNAYKSTWCVDPESSLQNSKKAAWISHGQGAQTAGGKSPHHFSPKLG
jgi:hypothetical protein